VWNRTLDPIFLLDQDGKRLDVAACDYAETPIFRMNEYQVFTDDGLWFSGSEGGSGPAPAGRRFVIVARPSEPLQDVPAVGSAPPLPACEGHAGPPPN
jgi:hypothetical protein